ncbi:SpoIIE family protein phosphatase [bacterium]|nr:SpoIIE family protein phosphatase [bacterium]
MGPLLCIQICVNVEMYLKTHEAIAHQQIAILSGDPVIVGPRHIWLESTAATSIWGLIVIYVAGKRISRPVKRFVRTAAAMTAGDFRRPVTVKTGDELQVLGEAFNSLGESLVEHELALKRQSVMLSGMMEAVRSVSSSLDVKTCGKSIAKAVCAHLGADGSVVFMKNVTDGGLKTLGFCGHCQKVAWKRLANHAADSGGYLVITEHNAAQSDAGVLLVGVPLSAGSETIGSIVARFSQGISRDDLKLGSIKSDLLITFGIHAAAAIVNARMHSETEKYSEVLEDWVEHLSAVMEVTNAISPSLNLDETLTALAGATTAAMGADDCAIYLISNSGKLVSKNSCTGWHASVLSSGIEPGELITGRAFKQQRHYVCCDMTKSLDANIRQISERTGSRSAMSAPLIVENQALGAITVYNKEPHNFTTREIRLLTSIALHAAVIVCNAGLYTRQASIAEQLQSSLVSEAPESCMGLNFAARYIPALNEARVGGDFYDVFVLPNDKVALVIADVSGKGLMAAIHLAACKHMLKAMLFEYPDDPAYAMGELNNAMNHFFELSFFMTAFCGIIDPTDETLVYANAGHPPALLITEQGKMQHLLAGTGIPAGSGQDCKYDKIRVRFHSSDTLLLYTDGVTDAVNDGNMLGVEGIQRMVFEAMPCSPRDLIEYICGQLCNETNFTKRDDIALLAAAYGGAMQSKDASHGGSREQRHSITTHSF